MLEIRDLEVAYGKVVAVKGISLDVGSNEIVALIGNNGAGKTTTLKTISGLINPRKGSIMLNGRRIDRLPVHVVSSLGIVHVPEGRKIFSKLTVHENLLIGAYLKRDKARVKAAMERVLDLFPILKERLRQAGGTLSGGEQQMLAIGRGLMAEPKLLLLDEPSLGLAPLVVEKIVENIVSIARSGIPILLVEQNARLALEISSRSYVIETGQIVMNGKSSELLASDTVRKAYLGVA
ncbi:MAG: ABC transporter ATP-binding protein [Ignavibacteriales bacterium]